MSFTQFKPWNGFSTGSNKSGMISIALTHNTNIHCLYSPLKYKLYEGRGFKLKIFVSSVWRMVLDIKSMYAKYWVEDIKLVTAWKSPDLF